MPIIQMAHFETQLAHTQAHTMSALNSEGGTPPSVRGQARTQGQMVHARLCSIPQLFNGPGSEILKVHCRIKNLKRIINHVSVIGYLGCPASRSQIGFIFM